MDQTVISEHLTEYLWTFVLLITGDKKAEGTTVP